MDEVPCDLCGSLEWRKVYAVRDTNYGSPGLFNIVECCKCRLVFVNPRPAPDRMAAYYPEGAYHPFKAMRNEGSPVPSSQQRKRASELTRRLGPGRVLDVGCGTGLFLIAMRSEGWKTVGVEPNSAASSYARKECRLDVHTGLIHDLNDASSFDLITFWEVLEHTNSPRDVLVHANRLLRPRGYLAASVPNWAGLERRLFRGRWTGLDSPRHLYHFTPRTLSIMLDKSGFRVLSLKARATALSLSSSTLRMAGDTFLRAGASKSPVAASHEAPNSASLPFGKRSLIAITHMLMKLPNAMANALNLGSGIQVLAQKRE